MADLQTWKVQLNDCDSMYVVAESEESAIEQAITEWLGVGHGDEEDLERDDVEAKVEPRIPANELRPEMLVHLGLAWWECSDCGAHVTSGMVQHWDGDEVTCGECIGPGGKGPFVPGPIFLSTEY